MLATHYCLCYRLSCRHANERPTNKKQNQGSPMSCLKLSPQSWTRLSQAIRREYKEGNSFKRRHVAHYPEAVLFLPLNLDKYSPTVFRYVPVTTDPDPGPGPVPIHVPVPVSTPPPAPVPASTTVSTLAFAPEPTSPTRPLPPAPSSKRVAPISPCIDCELLHDGYKEIPTRERGQTCAICHTPRYT